VDENGKRVQVAEGYERTENLQARVAEKVVTWVERLLVVRSLAQAQAAETALQARLGKALLALQGLTERRQGKGRLTEIDVLQKAAETLLKQHDVEGLLCLSYRVQVKERTVRQDKDRPAETRLERSVALNVQRDEDAIRAAIARLGWRVYGTNQPAEQLPLEQAILAYREEYRSDNCALSFAGFNTPETTNLLSLSHVFSFGTSSAFFSPVYYTKSSLLFKCII
jgi:transposase